MDFPLNTVRGLPKLTVSFSENVDRVPWVREFKLKYFESIEEYDYEIYGKYKGEHVMINKEDFNNAIL